MNGESDSDRAPDQGAAKGRANFRERLASWWRRNDVYLILPLSLFLLAVVYLWNSIFIVINSGHAGVVFRTLRGGTDVRVVRDEGLQVMWPWNKLTVYDVRVQRLEHEFSVISSNGLTLRVTVAIRFRPTPDLLGVLHKEIGPDYANKIVIPEVQARLRTIFGQYSPEEIYATKRGVIQAALQSTVGDLGEKYLTLDNLLIREITLPHAVREAIESKLVEEQRFLEMRFRRQREEVEAERKLVEANGIKGYNDTIASSLSKEVLTYHAIDATLELAKSHNAKVIVFGSSGGMPLLLDARFPDLPSGVSVPVAMTNLTVGGTNAPSRDATNAPSP